MRSLVDYIKLKTEINKFQYPCDAELSFENFLLSNKVNDQNVTEDMMNWYANNVWDKNSLQYGHQFIHSDDFVQPFEYVNEMLNSVSIDLLLKQLNKELRSTIYIDRQAGFDNEQNTAKQLKIPHKAFDIDKIVKVCDKMMWYVTSVYQQTSMNRDFRSYKELDINKPVVVDKKWILICIEPVKSSIKTDFVNNECNSIVYHICKRDKLNDILKSGLRPKGEKNGYRFIKNKVYLFCGKDNEQLNKNSIDIAKSKEAWDKTTDKFNENDFCVIKIDCSKYNIDFYEDTFYDGQEGIIYTYAYFPPKLLKEVKFNEITT